MIAFAGKKTISGNYLKKTNYMQCLDTIVFLSLDITEVLVQLESVGFDSLKKKVLGTVIKPTL